MLHTSPRREEIRVDQEKQPHWEPNSLIFLARSEQRLVAWGWQSLRLAGWLLLVGTGIVLVLVVLVTLIRVGASYPWTGFPKQKLWDWLDLLIVPIVLAIGGYLFNRQQRARELQIADQHAQDEALR